MRFRFAFVALIGLCIAATASAQDARFEGTVRLVIGNNLIITTGKGDVVIALTPHTRVTDASVADLKPGVTVGANTTKGADGKVAATLITIERQKTK